MGDFVIFSYFFRISRLEGFLYSVAPQGDRKPLCYSETPRCPQNRLSIKLRPPPPPGKSVNFEGFLLILYSLPHFGPSSRGGGLTKKFCGQKFCEHPDLPLCYGHLPCQKKTSFPEFCRKCWGQKTPSNVSHPPLSTAPQIFPFYRAPTPLPPPPLFRNPLWRTLTRRRKRGGDALAPMGSLKSEPYPFLTTPGV